jgi:hypothetical protein
MKEKNNDRRSTGIKTILLNLNAIALPAERQGFAADIWRVTNPPKD